MAAIKTPCGTKFNPVEASDWSWVFDLARECNRPMWGVVAGLLAKAFPSGRLEGIDGKEIK